VVSFSGFTWGVKSSVGAVGPGPNHFSASASNVWVDGAGRIHLRLTHRDGQWRCAEVVLANSLGYGTYRFALSSPVGALDPNVVVGLFTWSDDPAAHHREIDIELIRSVGTANAQFVVQPAEVAGHLKRFRVPASAAWSVSSFRWGPTSVSFSSSWGPGPPIRWRYAGAAVPQGGDAHARINLWLVGGSPPTGGAEVEVVVSAFSFTPSR